ncbi:MAG: hypothetical protein ACMUIE_02865 [Thermoplasmatota archaeon]
MTRKRLEEFFDLNRSTLRYHLEYLERKKKIIRKREGGAIRYEAVEDLLEPSSKRKLSRVQDRLFRLISGNPGITLDHLLQMSSDPKERVMKGLDSLERRGLITSSLSSGETKYHILSREEMRRRIYIQLVRDLVAGRIDESAFLELTGEL